MTESERTILAFVHIEKAAGTTLHVTLSGCIPGYFAASPVPDSKGTFSDAFLTADRLAFILKVAPFVRGVGGHSIRSYAGYERIGGRRFKYLTFLREPVARYVSHYQYQREVMKRARSFEEFLDCADFNDVMCRRICGAPDSDRAIDEINRKFFYVGLMEEFERSMQQLHRQLITMGLTRPMRLFTQHNRRVDRSHDELADADELRAAYAKEIESRNRNDKRVYEFVSAHKFSDHQAGSAKTQDHCGLQPAGSFENWWVPLRSKIFRRCFYAPLQSLAALKSVR